MSQLTINDLISRREMQLSDLVTTRSKSLGMVGIIGEERGIRLGVSQDKQKVVLIAPKREMVFRSTTWAYKQFERAISVRGY